MVNNTNNPDVEDLVDDNGEPDLVNNVVTNHASNKNGENDDNLAEDPLGHISQVSADTLSDPLPGFIPDLLPDPLPYPFPDALSYLLSDPLPGPLFGHLSHTICLILSLFLIPFLMLFLFPFLIPLTILFLVPFSIFFLILFLILSCPHRSPFHTNSQIKFAGREKYNPVSRPDWLL